jgi:hypothetical protein
MKKLQLYLDQFQLVTYAKLDPDMSVDDLRFLAARLEELAVDLRNTSNIHESLHAVVQDMSLERSLRTFRRNKLIVEKIEKS